MLVREGIVRKTQETKNKKKRKSSKSIRTTIAAILHLKADARPRSKGGQFEKSVEARKRPPSHGGGTRYHFAGQTIALIADEKEASVQRPEGKRGG